MSTVCHTPLVSLSSFCFYFFFFFFNDTATTEIYTLSLHDALPISLRANFNHRDHEFGFRRMAERLRRRQNDHSVARRSEEHTSELQSHHDLVCRLLLEKKNKKNKKKNSQHQ